MHWLLNAHVRRYLRHYHSSGHIWQGRFKAFPNENDDPLRIVLRYVERNPLRANLVERAEAWPWSSLRLASGGPALDPGPAPRGPDWVAGVNAPMTEAECESVRESIRRDLPFDSPAWVDRTASRLGLEFSLGNRGRPRLSPPGDAGGPASEERGCLTKMPRLRAIMWMSLFLAPPSVISLQTLKGSAFKLIPDAALSDYVFRPRGLNRFAVGQRLQPAIVPRFHRAA
jgi:hypothetical protein